MKSRILYALIFLLGWTGLYSVLPSIARWGAYGALGLQSGSRLGSAVEFFLYDTPKVLMLLTLVVFVVGVVRSYFTPERARRLLSGRRESAGNGLAALLGIVTPFCSCSAVPLFIGFVTAGVPLGVTFSFLVSAPMVNEIALALLFAMFGWRIALLYLTTGLLVAFVSGWTIGRLKMEKHVEPWVFEAIRGGDDTADDGPVPFEERIRHGQDAVKEIVCKVWPWVVGGIAVGAGIHGYVPDGMLAGVLGKGAWWSVPFAVAVGVPMYSNAAGILPVVQALLGKGVALGTALAFMMAVIALSLPEFIILRQVLKIRLIAVFAGVVATRHPARRLPVQRDHLKPPRRGTMKIEVLGSGCAKCDKVESAVRQAVAEAGVAAEVVKVKDIQAIIAYKVMMTPAVVIDGKVALSGRVPTVEEVKSLLAGTAR